MGAGKFYNHFISYVEENKAKHCDSYVVPYCDLIDKINNGVDSKTFSQNWFECLKSATQDFDERLQSLWKIIFVEAQKKPELSGALPEDALRYFIDNCPKCTTELMTQFQDLQHLAMTNAEALIHLIRNFDERVLNEEFSNVEDLLTSSLTPHLVTSSFMLASSSLVSIVSLLQSSLETEEEIIATTAPVTSNEKSTDLSRAEELKWFHENVAKLDFVEKNALVGHRGFHHVSDKVTNRPVENTLTSFEQIWAANISTCECDVALTKDGKIVLAHDENFTRLALLADCELSVEKVSDLTLREIFSLPLKGGTRPPLLSDVLRSAAAIGDHCKLVIEIKPGNTEICVPLISLFARNPALLKYVGVIMSFDSYIMSELSVQMADLADMLNSNKIANDKTVGKSVLDMQGSMMMQSAISRKLTSVDINSKQNSLLISLVNFDSILESQNEMPKLILVTMSEPTKAKFCTSVKDSFSNVDNLMEICGLDGVYLEYEEEMLEPEGIESMKQLGDKFVVGVWMDAKKHPDKLSLCRDLLDKCKVSYINTDFPPDFFDL